MISDRAPSTRPSVVQAKAYPSGTGPSTTSPLDGSHRGDPGDTRPVARLTRLTIVPETFRRPKLSIEGIRCRQASTRPPRMLIIFGDTPDRSPSLRLPPLTEAGRGLSDPRASSTADDDRPASSLRRGATHADKPTPPSHRTVVVRHDGRLQSADGRRLSPETGRACPCGRDRRREIIRCYIQDVAVSSSPSVKKYQRAYGTTSACADTLSNAGSLFRLSCNDIGASPAGADHTHRVFDPVPVE